MDCTRAAIAFFYQYRSRRGNVAGFKTKGLEFKTEEQMEMTADIRQEGHPEFKVLR